MGKVGCGLMIAVVLLSQCRLLLRSCPHSACTTHLTHKTTGTATAAEQAEALERRAVLQEEVAENEIEVQRCVC